MRLMHRLHGAAAALHSLHVVAAPPRRWAGRAAHFGAWSVSLLELSLWLSSPKSQVPVARSHLTCSWQGCCSAALAIAAPPSACVAADAGGGLQQADEAGPAVHVGRDTPAVGPALPPKPGELRAGDHARRAWCLFHCTWPWSVPGDKTQPVWGPHCHLGEHRGTSSGGSCCSVCQPQHERLAGWPAQVEYLEAFADGQFLYVVVELASGDLEGLLQ